MVTLLARGGDPAIRVPLWMSLQRLLVEAWLACVTSSLSLAMPGIDPGRFTFTWTLVVEAGVDKLVTQPTSTPRENAGPAPSPRPPPEVELRTEGKAGHREVSLTRLIPSEQSPAARGNDRVGTNLGQEGAHRVGLRP